jgi:hypothetical protein
MSMTLDLIKIHDDRSIMNAIEDEMEHIASDVSQVRLSIHTLITKLEA